ncbi:alpha/beta hydrolase [Ktedonobacter sp. SOSP1-52]|uniref:alpha/beta hydrolase n=1 Tax=Ktedonobacter sp. SOSP1-52 TaxID=2778366 RepID=UPI00191678DC|nr:alpha/beta hydrolase [Ktedonobacter sp. SOSP1-52]
MEQATQPEVIPVWPEGAPGTHTSGQYGQETVAPHLNNLRFVRNVVQPTLTAYLPDPSRATGTAVIVCPGGSFLVLTIDPQGINIARWLNARGATAFVLNYRLLPTPARDEDYLQQSIHPDPEIMSRIKTFAPQGVMDGKQALRVVRERASQWRINPERIGIMGFSAGGIITIGVATQYEAESRPNFAAPIGGSLWQELVVPADAPPLFLVVTDDDEDQEVPDGNIALYHAWRAAGRSAELHIYSKGGHGFAVAPQGLPCDSWIERFGDWLAVQGLLE